MPRDGVFSLLTQVQDAGLIQEEEGARDEVAVEVPATAETLDRDFDGSGGPGRSAACGDYGEDLFHSPRRSR